MIMIIAMAGCALLFLVAVLIFVLRSKKGASTSAVAKSLDDGEPLKESLPVVRATVQGEKAADVIQSGYFQNVFPGVTVIAKPAGTNPAAALPKNAPAFLLLTNSGGTVTGVDANNVLWNAPAEVPAKM